MSIRTREQAAQKAEAATTNVPDTCQLWTRELYNAPSAGDVDHDKDADAVDGWLSEPVSARHPGDRNPPRGVPVAWSGGSSGHGHRAISLGGGKIRSTDAGGSGRVATVDLSWPETHWGLHYTGWSETIDGQAIPADTTPTPTPTSSGLRVDLVDVSHHQTQDFDYTAGRNAGVRAVVHKATEGSSYVDPAYASRRNQILGRFPRLFGRPRVGAYHFARPSGGDAIDEAKFFLAKTLIKRGDFAPVLDLEVTGGLTLAQLDDWAVSWGRIVKDAHPVIGIYTPFDLPKAKAFFDFTWRPRYNNDNRPPELDYDIFQFSNGVLGRPNEVDGYGHVDLSTLAAGVNFHDLVLPRRKKHTKPTPKPQLVLPFGFTAGRYDRSAASLEVLLDDLMASRRLIAGTEVASEVRAKKIKEKHWAHFRGPNKPGADECFIAWPRLITEVIHADSIQVTDLTYFSTGGAEMAPTHVCAVVIRDLPTNQVGLVTAAHYPAHVEGHSGDGGIWTTEVPRRVAVHRSAIKGTARLLAEWEATYKPDFVIHTADFNLDIMRAAVRSWIAGQFPGFDFTFPIDYKGSGDLGRRVISWQLTKGLRVTGGPTIHTTPASDHGFELIDLVTK